MREEEAAKLVANQVRPIAEATRKQEEPAVSQKLYLKFCLGKDYLLDRIKPLLTEKNGNVPVCIHIEETKSTAMAPKTLWVSPDEELLADLKVMLGDKNVVLK